GVTAGAACATQRDGASSLRHSTRRCGSTQPPNKKLATNASSIHGQRRRSVPLICLLQRPAEPQTVEVGRAPPGRGRPRSTYRISGLLQLLTSEYVSSKKSSKMTAR